MTTVIDPLGTPEIIFNKGGTALVTLAANGTSLMEATPIPYVAGHIIVLVTSSDPGTEYAISLPAAAEIGDLVEVYGYTTEFSPNVMAPAGQTIRGVGGGSFIVPDIGRVHRKISATEWGVLAGKFS